MWNTVGQRQSYQGFWGSPRWEGWVGSYFLLINFFLCSPSVAVFAIAFLNHHAPAPIQKPRNFSSYFFFLSWWMPLHREAALPHKLWREASCCSARYEGTRTWLSLCCGRKVCQGRDLQCEREKPNRRRGDVSCQHHLLWRSPQPEGGSGCQQTLSSQNILPLKKGERSTDCQRPFLVAPSPLQVSHPATASMEGPVAGQ